MKQALFILVLAAIFSAGFFIFTAHTNTPSVVITEIGATEKGGLEWIELYNASDIAIDVQDWIFWEADTNHALSVVHGTSTIAAGEFFIIAQDADQLLAQYNFSSTTVFDSAWGSLKESGEEIGIKNVQGEFIEKFTYVTSTDFSLEKVDIVLNDYSEENWKEHPAGNSIGQENFWSVNPEEIPEQPVEPQEEPVQEPQVLQEISSSTILMSEVVSNPESGGEWIELWVSGTSTGRVTGLEIFDAAQKIANVSSTVSSSRYIVVDLPSAKLNNGGDIVQLKTTQGVVLDELIYGSVEGVSSTLSNIEQGMSAMRNITEDSNSSTPFFLTTQITRGEKNIFQANHPNVPDVEPVPSGGGGNSSPSNIPEPIEKFSILMNEIVSDPVDEQEEFIELLNTTNKTISLSNWWIEDGSERKTILEGELGAQEFFVVEKPNGSLNNSGDQVTLFDPNGNIIDQLTYGNWDDGDLSDNAPAPKDPNSLSRGVDGKNSQNNALDFFVTKQVTKGSENIIAVLGEKISEENYSELVGKIVLSEVFPNPKGSDSEGEFIEVLNTSNQSIDLNEWKLGDGSKKRYTFEQTIIQAHEYIVLYRSDSGISLNNSGEESVHLYAPNELIIDSLSYSGKVLEDQSYIRYQNEWVWTNSVTPGKENIVSGEAVAPIVSLFAVAEGFVGEELYFDASDSVDPANLELQFFWDFGDGKTANGDTTAHVYREPGLYQLLLKVKNNSGASSTKQLFITIHESAAFIDQTQASIESLQQQIQISEFLPNPKGSDYAEFIELYNPSLVAVDLSGMQLDDQEGGSRIFTFPNGSIIAPQEYVVLERKETGLALNNTGDSVRLFSPEKELLREVVYEGSVEGASYSLDELGGYVWSLTPTPGAINKLDEVDELVQPKSSSQKIKKDTPIISTTIAGAKLQDVGDRVEVYGVVTALPDVFGSQYFYIGHGGEGIQVYMYKKDFPDLYEGKGVYVIGELAEISGEMRIKTKEKTDIRAHDEPGIIVPTSTEIHTLGIEDYGGLVQLAGEITEVKSSHAYVDDGTEEVRVYFKRGTGITKKDIAVGDLAAVTGVVSQSKGDLVVLPRSVQDIKKTGVSQEAVVEKEQTAQKQEEAQVQMYLLTTAGGITALLIGLILRQYGPVILELIKKRIHRLNK